MFLGVRIIRKPKGRKRYVYPHPSNAALAAVKRRVKTLTGRSTIRLDLAFLLRHLNPVLRGWAAYFRYTAAKRTFSYLGYYAWWRVIRWLRRKHPQWTWGRVRRRFFGKDAIREGGFTLYNPAAMRVLRYGFRGGRIPTHGARLRPS